jgi:hypothetical protein
MAVTFFDDNLENGVKSKMSEGWEKRETEVELYRLHVHLSSGKKT